MGVWIETVVFFISYTSFCVAPLVGVWIETCFRFFVSVPLRSLPSWECGLKLDKYRRDLKACQSLPSWECGLKQP